MTAPADGSQWGATILHVDLDAFYASVEIMDNPELEGKPVIVGGLGDRGVVAAASYEARRYGVRSAMPGTTAKRQCPNAIFLKGRFDRYSEVSAQFHEVLESFTPLVEGLALDEAFCDIAGARRLLGPPSEIAWSLRSAIRERTGLWASVGVAASKSVAKLASVAAKPKARSEGVSPGSGVVVVLPGREADFLHPLPLRALWGVGPATAERLRRLGLVTVGDVATADLDVLRIAMGPRLADHLVELSWGSDPRPVVPSRPVKSISHEETYTFDLDDGPQLRREVVRLCDAVATRLVRSCVVARTVSIKVRAPDFHTVTRSRTLQEPTDVGRDIATVAGELLDHVDLRSGVRLLGVACSGLAEPKARQLTFDDLFAFTSSNPDRDRAAGEGSARRWERVSEVMEQVRQRFGDNAVAPASLVSERGLGVKRMGSTQWGPEGKEPVP